MILEPKINRNANKVIVTRTFRNRFCTQGHLQMYDGLGTLVFECNTLELSWKDNKKKVSCIPASKYPLVDRNYGTFTNKIMAKFGHKFVVQLADVENRRAILIHHGNYPRNTHGCILVGNTHLRSCDKSSGNMVTSSNNTYKKFFAAYKRYQPKQLIIKENLNA